MIPAWLTPYLLWIKLAGAALALGAAFGSGMWLQGTIKDKQIAIIQRDAAEQTAVDATAALTTLQRFISQMHDASIDYTKSQDALFAKLDALDKRFRDAIKNRPLPPDCKPDDVRMQQLYEAIAAANAAAASAGGGFGETVRTTH
jgi:hypothetical protein